MVKENHYKISERWYLTPVGLERMFLELDSHFWKCGNRSGTFMHMWWFCPEIQKSRLMVYKNVRQILHCSFPFEPQIMFLADFKACSPARYSDIAANLFTAASQLIALKWKDENPPMVDDWLTKSWHVFLLNKLTSIIRFYTGHILAVQWFL